MRLTLEGIEYGQELVRHITVKVEHEKRFFTVWLDYKRHDLLEVLIVPNQKKTQKEKRPASISWWLAGTWYDRASDPVAAEVMRHFEKRLKIA